MAPLCWRHHTLIQALLSRGPLKENKFQSILSDVTGKSLDSHGQLLNEYLRKMNMELSYVQFELRACRNQYDGCVYYGVINTVADEQSKLGTRYTPPQIAFYKAIIEAIVQDSAGEGSISNMEALNTRVELQGNFSMSQKEKTIQEFVEEQWLCESEDGRIGLGVRSFLDLRSWFHNNQLPPCHVCNEPGIKADLCPNASCSVRIHNYCLQAKFSLTREKVCPDCGSQWPFTLAKAEAVEEEPEPLIRKRSRGSGSRQVQENGDEEGLTGSQPSTRRAKEGPPTRRATRTSTRLHP